MSKVIDERVVSMEFENKNFEKNVNQTIKSLERLKEALNVDQTTAQVNNISKSLANIENSIKSSNLASVVTKKFSIVGTVVDQLTRNFTNKFANFITGTIDNAVAGGAARAQKLADANFMLKGILGETTDSAAQLDQIMKSVSDSVDGTAYSLDAAATVAAQLAATGMRGGEEMTNTLKGIAGTAAMTSSSFEEIGMIYTKVMAKGHLMGDQVNQLAYRGLNVTEELGKALGKTGDEITKMVSKGQIDFKTFSDALYNAFGEHAAKANDTYAGSLANLHSALNRITADVQAAKFEALKDIFNALRILVNQVKKDLEPTIKLVVTLEQQFGQFAVKVLQNPLVSGILHDSIGTINNLFMLSVKIMKVVRTAFSKVFSKTPLRSIKSLTNGLYILTSALLEPNGAIDILKAGFEDLFKMATSGFEKLKNIGAILVTVFGTVINVFVGIGRYVSGILSGIHSVGDALSLLGRVTLAGFGTVLSVVSNFVNTIKTLFSGLHTETEETNNVILATFENVDKQIGGNGGKLHDMLQFLIIIFSQLSVKAEIAGKTILNFVKTINWGYVILIAFAVSVFRLINGFSKLTEKSAKAVGALGGIVSSLSNIAEELKNTVTAYKKSVAASNFRTSAIAIAILAASLAALVLVLKDADVGKIIAVAAALALLSASVFGASRLSGNGDVMKVGAAILALGATLTAVAHAIKMMNDINVADLKTFAIKLGVLAAVFAAVVAVTTAIGHFGYVSNATLKLSVMFIPLVIALNASASALQKLNDVNADGLIEKVDNLNRVLGVMGVLMVTLELVNRLPGSKTTFWDKLGFFAMAIGISYMVNAVIRILGAIPFDKFSEVMTNVRNFSDEVIITGLALTGAGILLMGLGKAVRNIGAGVMEFGAGILFISAAMQIISTVPGDQMAKAILVTGGIAIALWFMVKAVDKLPDDVGDKLKGAAKTFVALGALIFAMSVSLALLTLIQPEKLMVPLISLGVLLGMVAAVVNRAYNLKDAAPMIRNLTIFMIAISAVIALLARAIDFASKDFTAAMSFLASIGVVLGILGALSVLLEKMQQSKVNKNVKMTILALTAAIAALVAGIIFISNSMNSLGSIAAMVASFAMIMYLMDALYTTVRRMHKMTARGFDPKMLQIILSLVVGLGTMVATMVVLAKSMTSLGSAASMIVSFGIVILLLEKLTSVSEQLHSLSSKKPDLKMLSIIGALVASLVFIAGSIYYLAQQPWGRILVATIAVGAFLAEFAYVIEKLNSINSSSNINLKMLSLMGAIVVSLVFIVGSMYYLAQQPWGKIIVATTFVGAFLAEFAYVVKKLNDVNASGKINLKMLALMGTLAAGLTITVLSMAELAKAPIGNIVSTVILVGLLMAEYAVIIKSLSNMNTVNVSLKNIVMLALITGAVSTLVKMLAKIAANDWQSIETATGSMALTLLSLAAATYIIGQVADPKALVGAGVALAVAGALALVGKALQPILQYNWVQIIVALGSMTVAIGILMAVVGVLGAIAGDAPPVALGIIAVSVALVALSAVFLSVGASAALFGLGIKLISDAFNQFATNCPMYADNIGYALDTIKEHLKSFIQETTVTISEGLMTLSTGIVNAAQTLVQGLFQVGMWIPQSIANGMIAGIQNAIAVAIQLATSIEEAIRNVLQIHSESPKFNEIGAWIVKSTGNGMNLAFPGIKDTTDTLAALIESGPEEAMATMSTTGAGIVAQLASGMLSGKGFLESAADTLRNVITTKLGGIFGGEGGFSLDGILNKSGIGNALNKAKRQAAIEKAAINTATDPSAMRKYIWNKKLKDTTGIDLEDSLKGVTDQLGDLTTAADGAAGGLGAAGGAAEKAGAQAKHSLKGWQELGAALEDTIDSQMDIFSEFERKSDLTADQVLHNMRSQIDGVREWSRNLYELSKRGLNSVLVQELSELGPQGYEKVNAFVQMTDEQLKEANELYAERLQMPQEASTAIVKSFAATGMWGMEGLKETMNYDAGKEVGLEVADGADEGFRERLGINSPSVTMYQNGEYMAEGLVNALESNFWNARVAVAARKLANSAITAINELMGKTDDNKAGENVTKSFSGGVDKGSKNATHSMMGFCKKILDTIKNNLPEKTFKDYGYMIWTKFEEGLIESYNKLTTTLKEQLKKFEKDYKKSFEKLGGYAADGLSEGIEKKLKKVTASIVKVCNKTIEEAKTTIKSNSPSKVFTEIGENITIGLANGITKMTDTAGKASEKAALNTITSFQNALDKSAQYVTDTVNDDMILTPILDLSQIEAGTSTLSNLLSKSNFEIGGTIKAAKIASGYFGSKQTEVNQPAPQQITNNYEFNQTNNSPKALSNAEIYRQTKNLFSTVKGATR